MKMIEHRRHTMRVQPGKHLSQAGVTLARGLGQTMGPFAHVVTSPAIRAYETAIAMGFAVNDLRDELKLMPDAVEAIVPYPAPFVLWAMTMRSDSAVQAYGRMLGEFMHGVLDEIDEGQRVLMVSHGGIIEASAVTCKLNDDWSDTGEALSYCEGVRLEFEGATCVSVTVLRLGS